MPTGIPEGLPPQACRRRSRAPVGDDGLRQAAAVNPEDKFELVFRNLLKRLFVERMDQNEEIFVRYMNDAPFRDIVSGWMASEVYRRLRTDTSHFDGGGGAVK
jgi:type I restriction enzyme R subunit